MQLTNHGGISEVVSTLSSSYTLWLQDKSSGDVDRDGDGECDDRLQILRVRSQGSNYQPQCETHFYIDKVTQESTKCLNNRQALLL